MNKTSFFTTVLLCLLSPISATDEIKITSTTKLRRRARSAEIPLDGKLMPRKDDLDRESINVDETMKIYDNDKDDFLSFYEFDMFCNHHPLCPSDPNLEEPIFTLADADDDGHVSYMELIWMAKYTDHVLEKFQLDDKNGDDFITMDELSSTVCDDEISCDFFIYTYDIDQDGKLNFTDYMIKELVMNMVADSLATWSFQEGLSMISLGVEEGTM